MSVTGNIALTPEFDYQRRSASDFGEGHLKRCFGDEASEGFVGTGIRLDSKLTLGLR